RDRNVTGVQTCALPIYKEAEVIERVPGYGHIHEISVAVYIGTFPCPPVGNMVCSRKVEIFIELVFKVMRRCLVYHASSSLSSRYAFRPSFLRDQKSTRLNS